MKITYDFTDRPLSNPHDFEVRPVTVIWRRTYLTRFAIEHDEQLVTPQLYLTEDDADAAIGKMIDEHDQEAKERLRDEDEAPYRGPRFGASYGSNSAGRS